MTGSEAGGGCVKSGDEFIGEGEPGGEAVLWDGRCLRGDGGSPAAPLADSACGGGRGKGSQEESRPRGRRVQAR